MDLRQRASGAARDGNEQVEQDSVSFDMPATPVRAASQARRARPSSRQPPGLSPRSATALAHRAFRPWLASATATATSWGTTAPRYAPASPAGAAASSSLAAVSCGSTSPRRYGPGPPLGPFHGPPIHAACRPVGRPRPRPQSPRPKGAPIPLDACAIHPSDNHPRCIELFLLRKEYHLRFPTVEDRDGWLAALHHHKQRAIKVDMQHLRPSRGERIARKVCPCGRPRGVRPRPRRLPPPASHQLRPAPDRVGTGPEQGPPRVATRR